jgi:uncharacterized membrane protein YgcG
MKTNVFFPRTVFFFALVGFLSVFIFSCGSFQNTSYYDRDGIYGSGNETSQQATQPTNQAAQYSNYFSSLQDPQQSAETFTDVDHYTSVSDSVAPQHTTQYTSEYTGSQGAWGSNATTTNFNFYNTNWGMNNYWYNSYWNDPFLFWGWDYWYSPYNMGWGFQPYMNYFGGFYPYYFYTYNPYGPQWYYGNAYYHGGRRNGMGRYGTTHNYWGNREISPRSYGNNTPRNPIRSNPNPRNNITNPRNSVRNTETGTRNYTNPRFSNSNPNLNMNGTRNYSVPRSNNNQGSVTSPRFFSSGASSPKSDPAHTRSNSSSGTRNYSPAPSNSGNYSGGSYNSTSGSGGRSSGGGRR